MSDFLPDRLDLPSIKKRDTYPAITITGGDAPDGNDLQRVIFTLKTIDCDIVIERDSEIADSGIEITNAAAWEVVNDRFQAPNAAGIYSYELDAIDSLNNRRTLVYGNLTVE